jgi:hypothetical protein
MNALKYLLAISLSSGLVSTVSAQLATGWKAHDWERAAPKIVTPGESNLPAAPPSDAIVLFDGSSLDNWCDSEGNPSKWNIVDGVMESVAGSGYIFTKQAFGDMQLHIEWAAPVKVEGRSQGRGNSGVFLMGLFEVQVLDSFDNRTYADGQAASVYGQYPPLVNASRRPGEWQAYDIIFHRPKFDARGALTDKATVTVLHNGVLVQDATRPLGPTSWILHKPYRDIGPKAPLSLQDHGNPVRYRNIWVRDLNINPYPPPTEAYDQTSFVPSAEQMDKYVGKYGDSDWPRYEVVREGRELHFLFNGNNFILIPHADAEFQLPYTAATVRFDFGDDGEVTGMQYIMGGDTNRVPKQVEVEDEPADEVDEADSTEEAKVEESAEPNTEEESDSPAESPAAEALASPSDIPAASPEVAPAPESAPGPSAEPVTNP